MTSAASAHLSPRGPAEAAAEAAWQNTVSGYVEVRAAFMGPYVFTRIKGEENEEENEEEKDMM